MGSWSACSAPRAAARPRRLRLIAGFVEPSAGEIAVGSRVVSSPSRTLPPETRNMSMIFQSYALWPHMTVTQNIAYGLTLRKLPRDTIAKKVAAILATTKLGALADRYPGELSGGQQQRVALARALIVEPETLLLDEPLSNLDANLREEMRFEVRRLHDQYRYTTVYVTHDQSEAMTTSDLIAVMNLGRSSRSARRRRSTTGRVPNSSPASSARATSSRGKTLDSSHVSVVGVTVRLRRRHAARRDRHVDPPARDQTDDRARRGGRQRAARDRPRATSFLGNSRDYMVELADGTQVRAVTAPAESIPQGTKVWLHLPPERCRALVG